MYPISRRELLRAAGAGALVLPLAGRRHLDDHTFGERPAAPLHSGAPML
ncbi:hypothetical protein [Kitasatospora sp. NPDC058190]